ncbi:MAG: hypothetical protein J0L61_11730 [Planctomycetes bacterium]|nr:hypothetical protein [Planctomycetota bacterium]
MATVTIACGSALLVWHHRATHSIEAGAEATRRAVVALNSQVRFRAAVSRPGLDAPEEAEVQTQVNQRGWPVTIEPAWFGTAPPVNRLTPAGCPWIEIATGGELHRTNPNVRVALDRDTASFWYNPALGIVRARVGPTATDEQAVALYNRVNATAVAAIVEAPADVDDAP